MVAVYFDELVVAVMIKVSNKTATKIVEKLLRREPVTNDIGGRHGHFLHQSFRVGVVRPEDRVVVPREFQNVRPCLFTIFYLLFEWKEVPFN